MLINSRLDGSPINIDVAPNFHYGIMLSGGLDSAVLLYLMLEDFKQKELPVRIQPFTIPKADGATLYIGPILNFMAKRFNFDLPMTILVGDPMSAYNMQSTTAVIDVRRAHTYIKQTFFATNQNPPNVELPGVAPKRIKESKDADLAFPFLKLHKAHIVDLAEQFGLQELYDITHSCTQLRNERCNECWQCNERKWAFTELNLTDTGVR